MIILFALLACTELPIDDDPLFGLHFAADPWVCGEHFAAGSPEVQVTPVDLRFLVSDVVLVDADGADVPAPIAEEAPWQSADVALVDLADADCGGSPDVREYVRLDLPPGGDYTGVRFTLGVPPALNHLDSEDAEPPLDELALWWGWRYGYKYVLLEVARDDGETWPFHLGASGCDDDGVGNYTCADDNLATIALELDPSSEVITVDVGALLGASDLAGDGCQTLPGDADCAPLFERLGLGWEGAADGAQVVFGP